MGLNNPRTWLKVFLACLCIFSQSQGISGKTAETKKNVLMIIIDDFRPEIGAFYNAESPYQMFPGIQTPHMDALASRSLVVRRGFVQQAVCSPSRASVLTSRRPDTTHVYEISKYFRELGGNFTTLPQYFKENGYATAGMGKVFHAGGSAQEDLPSWTEPYFIPPFKSDWTSRNRSWVAVPPSERAEKLLPDESVAEHAMETMQRLAPAARSGEAPFFLGVGFAKPHLPFVFPEEYLDLYPLGEVGLPSNPYAPRRMPGIGWSAWAELRNYGDIEEYDVTGKINNTLPNDVVRDLRRAYYASVSYVDDMVGRIMERLQELGLVDDTIIALWGDHGFLLGEHGMWVKHCNFELATRAPMMIAVPGLTDAGIVTDELVEFVDLFPTLAEVAGLPEIELCPEDSSDIPLCTEGSSLVPLMTSTPGEVQWKDRVFSQYPRTRDQTFARVMGYTMRTKQYRYTEWVGFSTDTYQPNWSEVIARELYDHTKDPEENSNRNGWASYAGIKAELQTQLRQGWRAARP